jgi:hypothetical protein
MGSHHAGRRAAAALLGLATLAVAIYLAPGWQLWSEPKSLVVSGGLLVAILAAVGSGWTGSRHSRAIGAVLLLAGSGLLVLDATGVAMATASPGPASYGFLLAAGTAIAAIGIFLRRRSARWLALGLAAAGAVSSGLNLSQWMWAGVRDGTSWTLAVWTLGSLTVLIALCGRDVAALDRLAAREEVWTRRDPLVRWMRAATLTAIVATPMLLVYATMQQGAVESLGCLAIVLAGYLAVAAFLSVRGQLLGGALLGLGGIAMLGLSAAALLMAPTDMTRQIACYYLIFWLPCAGTGLVCGVAVARSTGRLQS